MKKGKKLEKLPDSNLCRLGKVIKTVCFMQVQLSFCVKSVYRLENPTVQERFKLLFMGFCVEVFYTRCLLSHEVLVSRVVLHEGTEAIGIMPLLSSRSLTYTGYLQILLLLQLMELLQVLMMIITIQHVSAPLVLCHPSVWKE